MKQKTNHNTQALWLVVILLVIAFITTLIYFQGRLKNVESEAAGPKNKPAPSNRPPPSNTAPSNFPAPANTPYIE